MREKKARKVLSRVCISILIVSMIMIWIRTITRQLLVKQLGVNNSFTHMVLWDNEQLAIDDLGKGRETESSKVIIEWEKLYPFNDVDSSYTLNEIVHGTISDAMLKDISDYKSRVNSFTNKVVEYTSKYYPGYSYLVRGLGAYKKAVKWKFEGGGDTLKIVEMEDGRLTYLEPAQKIEAIDEIATSVSDFKNFLEEKEISFYYVNLASKIDPRDKELSPIYQNEEFTNENADELLNALTNRDVNVIDIRTYLESNEVDWADAYYKTDHHPTNRTGMLAASLIADTLNQNEGFNFDPFYFDIDNYYVTEYKKFWYGGQASALKYIGCEKDDYELILPRFPSNFKMEIPTVDYCESGSYDRVLFDYEMFSAIANAEEKSHESDKAYSCVRWRNFAVGRIDNLMDTNNEGQKILLLADSFSWYLTTYLACDVDKIDILCPLAYDGSIRTYIEKEQPDVVLMMYCARNIDSIEWTSHLSSFDLR